MYGFPDVAETHAAAESSQQVNGLENNPISKVKFEIGCSSSKFAGVAMPRF
jgi:hypothetical protein